MLTVKRLTKSFGDTKAVDDLSFSITAGEIVGFLGPNGAGKTTTMRLIAGYLSPDSGTIIIDDKQVGEEGSDARRYIGYLPENNPLYKDMLVSEFLTLSADLKNIPADKRRAAFDFAVSAVDIGDVFYRPVGELSKGYKQRIGMAVALLHRPSILILDEPTEGLDPNQRTEIRSLIKSLAKERTILLSTHVMQEASALCSRILIIHHGKLVADGTPKELAAKAQQQNILIVELEGKGIEAALKSMPGVSRIALDSLGGDRIRATLITAGDQLQPQVLALSAQHGWKVWRLAEEEHKLEDIFHSLTTHA
ncbi:MAG: ATP-binding cassette domain-containing protein [Candidatus Peribacteraceae bacterium]|nr:ATP-binding cassette domain-containing protein [Candidatus Peribacteraceae bacterium]